MPAPAPRFIKQNLPGPEAVAGFHLFAGEVALDLPSGQVREFERQRGIAIVEPEFFTVFPDIEWLSGSPEASLSAPQQLVLTEEKAALYFGTSQPEAVLGQELRYRDSLVLVVSGLVRPPTASTDLDFGEYISFATIEHSWLQDHITLDSWGNTNSGSQCFVKLGEGVRVAEFEDQLKAMDVRYAQENDADWIVNFHLQPFSDLHFNEQLGIFDHRGAPAHFPTLYGLIVVAVLILLLAVINFVNLETAHAANRAKEVGLRKVLGGTRPDLMFQFLLETGALTALAVLLALGLTAYAMTYFEGFLPKGLTFDPLQPRVWAFLLGGLVGVTLLAGIYPASMLSNFHPIRALKDQPIDRSGMNRSAYLRKGLIVFQFVFVQVLIFGTLIIGLQIRFLFEKDMGFSREHIVYVAYPYQE